MNTNRFIAPSSRLPELDGIRGIAIILVLIWHYVALGVPIDTGSRLFRIVFYLRQSWCGVDLFFVLSGFLIGGILLDASNSKKLFKTFYIRRALRILPLYFCLLIAFSIGAYLTAHGWGDAAYYGLDEKMPIWVYWLLLQNIWSSLTGEWGCHWLGVTWSLAIEEQFYLTLPLLIRYTPRRILVWIIGALIIAAPILRTILFYNYQFGSFAGYWLMPCRTDALGLGVMLAIVTRHKNGSAMLIKYRRLIQAAFLLS